MRTLTTIVLGLSIVFAPSWVYLPILFGAIFFHLFYLEGVVAGFCIDLLYGVGGGFPFFGYFFGSISTMTLLIAMPVRKYLRFNA